MGVYEISVLLKEERGITVVKQMLMIVLPSLGESKVDRKSYGRRIKMSEVIARVISQQGTCASEHSVGDEFVMGEKTPPGMCSWAFYTLFPFAEVLQFGGSFPWEEEINKTTVACPDPANPVVFELSKLSS